MDNENWKYGDGVALLPMEARTFNFKRTRLLMSLPQQEFPVEGEIVEVANQGEYCKVAQYGGFGGCCWFRCDDIVILAKLSTSLRKPLPQDFEVVLED